MFGVDQKSKQAGSDRSRTKSEEPSSSPLLREPVYENNAQHFGVLNKEAKFRAKSLAHRMVKWLLGIPVEALLDTPQLAFRTVLKNDGDVVAFRDTPACIGELLYRWPRSAHSEFGDKYDKSPIQRLVSIERQLELNSAQTEPITFDQISREFPAVLDYLESFKKKCFCTGCESEGAPVDMCPRGCLRRSGNDYLFFLIGNSVADGFGVESVSGMLQIDPYVDQVRRLFSQLLHGLILWNTWFNLAACTALGYEPRLFHKSPSLKSHEAEAGNNLVAAQYGSMVAAASWTDITREMKVKGCFNLVIALGSILGVLDEQAFVESEFTMQLMDMSAPSGPADIVADPDGDLSVRYDESPFKIETAVVSTENNYRLLTIASTEKYQRFVDPSFAILCLARSTRAQCLHHSVSPSTAFIEPHIQFQTLDTIFGTWDLAPDPEVDSPDVEPILIPYILDDTTKFNSILCLCLDGCILIDIDGCLDCAANATADLDASRPRRMIRLPKLDPESSQLVRR